MDDFSSYNYDDLDGAKVIANDGKDLGIISTNSFDPESISNEFCDHGSEFHADSILNEFGDYGSEFSELSPFSEFSSTPPRIMKGKKFIAYLTKNEFLSPRVSPEMLLAWLKND